MATTDTTPPLLLSGDAKRSVQPVQLYQCAGCGKNIADEAVPFAVRIAAFAVPQATRDRSLDTLPFDITDVGLPWIVRELVDANKHPDGHVILGLGCCARLLQTPTFNDAGEPVPIVPMRPALNAKGIPNTAFTGREHREPEERLEEIELYDKAGVRRNRDGSVWMPGPGKPVAPQAVNAGIVVQRPAAPAPAPDPAAPPAPGA